VVNQPLDLLDVDRTGHGPAVLVGVWFLEALRVVLVGDLPDELLGDVLERDDASQSAVLVEDARELVLRLAQPLQHHRQRQRVGDHQRRPGDLADPHPREVVLGKGQDVA
jgi:hypothetical protein